MQKLFPFFVEKIEWEFIKICKKKKDYYILLEIVNNNLLNIYISNHNHHAVPPAQISLTPSRHFSHRLSLLAGPQGYIPYPH